VANSTSKHTTDWRIFSDRVASYHLGLYSVGDDARLVPRSDWAGVLSGVRVSSLSEILSD
jgi:hypothetical protein